MSARLRFGIMCDGTSFPAWQARCIQALIDTEGVTPELLIVNPEEPLSYSRSEKLKRLMTGKVTLFRFYERLTTKASVADSQVDLASTLASVERIECRVRHEGRFSEYFEEDDIEAIRARDLDFVLRFSYGIIRGSILDVPRYGVWSFHHDDPDRYRGAPPGFWEIYHDDPVTGTILQRLTERLDGGVILHKGYFPTVDHSWVANRDAAFLGAADWPARMCQQILAGDTACFTAEPVKTDAPIFLKPTNTQMLKALWVMAKNRLRAQYRSLFATEQWNVGVVDRSVETFLAPSEGAVVQGVEWAPQAKGADFIADPGALPGREVVFVEEFDYAAHRGKISALPYTGRAFGELRTVLECPEHLSYPFLFEDGGQTYCIPEIAEAREVRLYRLPEGEDGAAWELDCVLLRDLAILDATLFEHRGRYWILCTSADDQQDAKLLGYHAPSLRGPWTPHALNPLKTDIRGSRPAGPTFVHEGVLYRPAQDSRDGYGAAVAIFRVEELTPTTFREKRVTTLRPDPSGPYPDGLHTLVSVGDRTIIDGRRNTFVSRAFRRELKTKIRRLLAVLRLRRPK